MLKRLFREWIVAPVLKGPLAGRLWLVGTRTSFFLGRYEPEESQAFMGALQEGSIVFDLGAHMGYYTLLASRGVGAEGRVFAFEPSPENARRLQRHVGINRCRNVTVLEIAVSDREGTARFENRCGSGTGHLADDGPLEVRTSTLDAMIAGEELPVPALVKIDVEGAEISVLEGAAGLLRDHRPTVLLSTHSDELREACHSILRDHGYELTGLDAASIEQADSVLAKPPAGD